MHEEISAYPKSLHICVVAGGRLIITAGRGACLILIISRSMTTSLPPRLSIFSHFVIMVSCFFLFVCCCCCFFIWGKVWLAWHLFLHFSPGWFGVYSTFLSWLVWCLVYTCPFWFGVYYILQCHLGLAFILKCSYNFSGVLWSCLVRCLF